MAQLLSPGGHGSIDFESTTPEGVAPRLWPVEKLILSYVVLTGFLILAFYSRVPGARWWLALHLAELLLVYVVATLPSGAVTLTFRHWYAWLYIGASYKEMSILIPAIRGMDMDRALAQVDFSFWRVHPTVWMERLQSPWVTEFLQIAYTAFVPAVFLVGALLWKQYRRREFRYYMFLITLGFLASFIGYFLVPARGPRYVLSALQHVPLAGLWSFPALRDTLDRFEATHYDCFPSGHVELTMLACWASRRISAGLFFGYCGYTFVVILATVYLRYHYTVDLLAGALLAVTLVLATPYLYGASGGGH